VSLSNMIQRVSRKHIARNSLKLVKTVDYADPDSTHAIEILVP